MKRIPAVVPLLTAGVLIVTVLSLVPQAPAAAATIDSRVGSLTSRPDLPGTGARRLTSASVRQDLYADRVSGTFVLDAEPVGEGTTSYLRVGFGHIDGSSCVGDAEYLTSTLSPSAGFTRSGRTITLRRAESQAGYEDWDCAFAVLDLDADGDQADGSLRSVLLGQLRDVAARPDLAITGVELLGARQLRLVPGVWTTLDVEVANRGRGDATGTVLRGAGRGLKVRTVRAGTIRDDDDTTARLQVKLVGRRSTTLRLTATGGGDRATRTVRVRKVAPPARPRPGGYRSPDGDTTFSVGRGRITGFRVRTTTRCGGYPDIPTTTWNTYSFRTVRIARNGIVDAREKGNLYTAYLRLRVAGGKVTSGRFSYYGPNRCVAVETFTARHR